MGSRNLVKLHLGCGKKRLDGWLNIDCRKFPSVNIVSDLKNLKKFENKSADIIYASHLLEHFSHKETNKILKEWNRVIKKNGKLYLAVPDFNKLILKFMILRNPKVIIAPLFGAQDYKENFHYTTFNFKSLKKQLKEAGFTKIKKTKFKFLPKNFEDNSKIWCSLNIVAEKI